MVATKFDPLWKKYEKGLRDENPDVSLKAGEAFALEREHQMKVDKKAKSWEESRKKALEEQKPDWVRRRIRNEEDIKNKPVKLFKQFGVHLLPFTPAPGYLLVQVEELQPETDSGIILATNIETQPFTGIVVAVGADIPDVTRPVNGGEEIIFKKSAGVEMTVEGVSCRFMQFSDVLGTYESDNSLIKKMPNRKTLEAFVEGMSGDSKVYFDTEKGEFIWN